jgi:hypothetical protein
MIDFERLPELAKDGLARHCRHPIGVPGCY